MDEFPPNTKKSKTVKPEEEKVVVEKIIEGVVIRRKKPLGSRFKEVFAGNFKSAGSYILESIIMPSVRGLIVDSVSKGTERIVMGETQRQMRRGTPAMGSRITYNTSPLIRDPRDSQSPQRALPMAERPRLDDIIIAQREDAEVIVETLLGMVEKYDFVSLADLMHMLGFATSYVDQGWGWSNLASISLKQVRDGYLIELPDPEPK